MFEECSTVTSRVNVPVNTLNQQKKSKIKFYAQQV